MESIDFSLLGGRGKVGSKKTSGKNKREERRKEKEKLGVNTIGKKREKG